MGMGVEKLTDQEMGFLTAMAVEQCPAPVEGKEDVASLLYFFQHVQGRYDILVAEWLTQRIIQQ